MSLVLFLTTVLALPSTAVGSQLRRTGQVLGAFDTIIAATAVHHGRTRITGNLAHLQSIPGLTLYQRAR